MKLVIDLMGSDLGPDATSEGLLIFHDHHPDVKLVAVGQKEVLDKLGDDIDKIEAKDVVAMDAGPLDVIRAKESSMYKAIDAVHTENADGVVSAGGTGAFLSAATLKLKLIPGIERAALVAPFPTAVPDHFVTILDIGASNENTANQLFQFAKMGQIYAEAVFGTKEPKTYLLNNGTEEGKGSPLTKEAFQLMKNENLPYFEGNIEARYALNGEADVIVTDGFTGNVFLKASEGIAKTMGKMLKNLFTASVSTKIGYLFTRKQVKQLSAMMNYKNTGGAMLLGINSVVVKAHGNSDGNAFFNAIEVAYKMVKNDVVDKIRVCHCDE